MNNRALAAEAIGTYFLVATLFGAALFGTTGPAVALGASIAIGVTVLCLAYAIGSVSGGHYNPAVTLGLVAGGRFDMGKAGPYIIAQCIGGLAAGATFVFLLGTGKANNLAGVANGYDQLSALRAGLMPVFIIEVIMTAFFLIVIMGATSKKAPAGFAPIAIGLALMVIHLASIPISNTSVNPARSLAAAPWGGPLAMSQLWVFVVAPIIGAVLGGTIARWLLEE